MQPIFVVGCQRSGTTLLGSLLGADPETITIPEAQFVADLAPADHTVTLEMRSVIDEIEHHYRYGLWNFDLAGERPLGRGSYADAIVWLVRRYADAQGKLGAKRWIDHQPGHIRRMAELLAHFPELKVIHIVRDGRAVAASLIPLIWGPNAVHSAAQFWAQRVAMGMGLREFLPSTAWIAVRYEDILADPERELRRLCEFLGTEFDPAMIEGGGFKVPAFTLDQHGLVGGRPVRARADAWRSSLTGREIEIFEALVGPLLTYLGYQRAFGCEAKMPSFLESARLTINDQLRAALNRRRFHKRVLAYSRRASAAGDRHPPDRVNVGDEVPPE